MPETTSEYSSLGASAPSATRSRSSVKDILVAFTISVLPLVTFSALLLGLVSWYRVIPHGHDDPRLSDLSEHLDKGVIYIDISATVLATVSSWSSTMAPLSLPFILAIASYPAARMMMRASDGDEAHKLPTPHQIALILRVLSNSSLSSVWHCMVYLSAKRRRAPRSSALNIMMCTLVLGTIQSIFIFATDTWLHITTKTVPITQSSPFAYSNASFGMPLSCTQISDYDEVSTTDGPDDEESFCRAYVSNKARVIRRSKMVQAVLSNTSERAMIQAYEEGGHKYAYIAPSTNFHIDYAATTFAVETSCTPVTSRCFDRHAFGSWSGKYHCDFGWNGTRGGGNEIALAYRENSSALNYPVTSINYAIPSISPRGALVIQNPYDVAAIVFMSNEVGQPVYDKDDEVFNNSEWEPTVIALLCHSMVFDVQYVSINGFITSFLASPSNSSTTMAMAGAHIRNGFNKFFILQRTISDLWASSTAQQVADRFGYTYSQAFLAPASAFIELRPAEIAQRRSSALVAAVPVAPLVCLLVANVLVVMLAIFLTVGALMEVTKCEEAGDVQTRLSIDALVAAHFETSRKEPGVRKAEDMFEEYQGGDGPRVRVEKTAEDGWKLVSCEP